MLVTEDEIAAFIERTIDEKLRERDAVVRVTLDANALNRAVTAERRRRARYGAP